MFKYRLSKLRLLLLITVIGILASLIIVLTGSISDARALQIFDIILSVVTLTVVAVNFYLLVSNDKVKATSQAKSNFLSNMSHEIRTPLNAIIGMTSIGKTASGMKKKDYAFEKIEEASTHLLGVINDVLDMSKIEANRMELSSLEFDFKKLINSIVNVINFKVEEKQLHLKVIIDENIPQNLIGDDLHLAQVITNLLSNAVKFTPGGGSINLEIKLVEKKYGVCTIQVKVKDTGIGISSEQQEHIFAPFQQADSSTFRKYGGTGLGLAISKSFIELMGGKITIESEPGRGATFTFTVKLMYDNDRCENLNETSCSPEVSKVFPDRRILLVEDMEINREILLSLLEPLEVKIDCAENGVEALRLYRENPDSYDIILMDVQMPEMDGLEATRQIRAFENKQIKNADDPLKVNKVPIIAMTANVFREDVEKCREAGMDDHLGKPIDINSVIEKLQNYLAA